MTPERTEDWNPGAYERFRGLRLQPALDLLSRVGALPPGPVVDLGCGSGVMGAALRSRFADREILGIDKSPAMLAKADEAGGYDRLQEADIAGWAPDAAPALIFSNAALQWLGDHPRLLPRLAATLAPRGLLAVQMPHQNSAPSHAGWGAAWAGLDGAAPPPEAGPAVLAPGDYFDLLAPLGEVTLWETDYLQHLAPAEQGHPVRLFTQSTFARPYLAALDGAGQQRLIAAYERAMARAYPLRADGSCLFPFRRLFLTLRPR